MEHETMAILLLLILSFSTSSELERSTEEEETRMLSTSSNLRVIEGSSVLLPCNALNTAETDVRMWRMLPSRVLFSGFISVSSDPKISLADKSSLHIVNITHEYSGEYLCSFFRKPHLKVLHKILVLVPPSISADPSHGKVIEQRGNEAKMTCHANGVPKPSITWTYELPNGTRVTSLPSGVHQVDEYQLHVASVDSHQAGHYQCTADNEVGSQAMADFNLTVLYAPEVVVQPDWVHGDEGATVEFVCTCSSAPLSQLVWLRGDPKHERYLHTDDRIKIREKRTLPTMTESWLKIQRMRREDLGPYTCLGRNTVGQAWKTVEVSGLAEPIQIRGTISGEDSFLLLWTAKSYSPIIEYQMKIRKYKDGDGWTDVMIPVEGSHRSIFYSQSYNVTGLDSDERYEVVLQAHNDFGWNRPSDSLFFGSGEEIFEEPDTQNIILSTSASNYDNALDVTNPAYLSSGSLVVIDWLFFLFMTTAGLWQRHAV